MVYKTIAKMSGPRQISTIQNFFDDLAPKRDFWISKNSYYYQELANLHQWLIETNRSVLEIGCGTGDLLKSVSPKEGEGIDFSHEMIKIAKKKHPSFKFKVMDAHNLEYQKTFDYVILSNLVGYVDDIWEVFRNLQKVSHPKTRIVITNYNYFWQPLMSVAEKLSLKMPDRIQNWLPLEFIEHFLYLNGFETVKKGKYLHIPLKIPYLSQFLNRIASQIPIINRLALIEYLVAKPTFLKDTKPKGVSTSVIVPTYNEAGNIERIVEEIPQIGSKTELIFVDLKGEDNTAQKIMQQIRVYNGPLTIKYVKQPQKNGKVNALRLGVKRAKGEIILIYDADLTVPPSDLPKFYMTLLEGKADLVNGTRMVYPTEKGAMRFINHLGNLTFAKLFTWSLGQLFTDTLCGTKGFWRKDFINLENTKMPFDNLDKYGDFYLLLEAYRRNFKIAEVPVRYKSRRYGDTKLDRFRNGMTFLKMFLYFFWNYKFLRKSSF